MQMKKSSTVQMVTKDIPGYGGLYYVTDDGRLFSHSRPIYSKSGNFRYIKKGCEVIGEISIHGYRRVLLSRNGNIAKHFVHRCVAICFHENPDNLPFVNHKDGDKLNNHKDNLEWVTPKGNSEHAFSLGLTKPKETIFSREIEEKIRAEYIYGSSTHGVVSLAEKYGVSKSLIHNIVRRINAQ